MRTATPPLNSFLLSRQETDSITNMEGTSTFHPTESTDSNSENQEELSVAEKAQLIRTSNSFSELYQAIEKIGVIRGSQETFEPDRLINIIDRVRHGKLTIDYVTQTHRIRDAVERLLENKPTDPPKTREAAVETEKGSLKVENPAGPIEPLTDEERNFISKAEADYIFMQNLSDDNERIEHYDLLKRKSERISSISDPVSFELLRDALASSSGIKDGNAILESGQLLNDVESIRKGDKRPEVLPVTLRHGVEKLVANEVLSRLEQEATVPVKDYEWDIFTRQFPIVEDFLGNRSSKFYEYSRIGDTNLHTREAAIDGKLAWCDGKKAIFKSTSGFTLIPFENIVLRNGKTLKEITEKENQQRRKSQNAPRARRIGE